MQTNLPELNYILDLQKVNSFYELIGRMQVLVLYLESRPTLKKLNAFTRTYYYVTREVAAQNIKLTESFDSYEDMEKLDIYFASLYFNPLKLYLTEGKFLAPWDQYFSYINQENISPFLAMLLGINTHINADLCTSLKRLEFDHDEDFELINEILLRVVPSVMESLALFDHDIFGFGASIFRNITVNEFQKVVVKWRNNARENAKKLHSHQKDKLVETLYEQVESVNKQLIDIFTIKRIQDASQLLVRLNELEVKI